MKTVGRRKQHPVAFSASARALTEGARFNEELQRLPTGGTTFIPKGLYRFKTHEEANRHAEHCLVEGMAQVALDRVRWMNIAARPRSKT